MAVDTASKNFGFGPDEEMLRDIARKFFTENLPVQKLRELVAGPAGVDGAQVRAPLVDACALDPIGAVRAPLLVVGRHLLDLLGQLVGRLVLWS